MQPYDPLSRLANEASHPDAIATLELCLRFLTASTLDDLTTVKEIAEQRLAAHPRPIDPLEHIYTAIHEAAQQRLPVLEATLLWAQRHDSSARIVDHVPASWTVELSTHNQHQHVQAAFAPMDEEQMGDDTITLLVDGNPVVVHFSEDGSLQL
jgi:hypothetical protein